MVDLSKGRPVDSRWSKTYPVNLLVSGRRCLVVGGGKVALRKAQGLVEAGAKVTLVAPDIRKEADGLAVRCVRRPFRRRDLIGKALVFAATDRPELNRQILGFARQRGILGCAVDAGWTEGDFITPASFSHEGMTVAVGSGGSACRRSRMLRDRLRRERSWLTGPEPIVIGTDAFLLDDGRRGRLPVFQAGLAAVEDRLSCILGIHEFVLLVTCDRIELLALAVADGPTLAMARLALGLENLADHEMRLLRGREAFLHSALVALGRHARNHGERHIEGQVKGAFAEAKKRGRAGLGMDLWLRQLLPLVRLGHRRAQGRHAPLEVEDRVLACIWRTMGRTAGRRGLTLCGTGYLGRKVARQLAAAGYSFHWLYHRQPPQPVSGATVGPLTDLPLRLASTRTLVLATRSPRPLLSAREGAMLAASPVQLVIDLGMPRNADPELETHGYRGRLLDLTDLAPGDEARRMAAQPFSEGDLDERYAQFMSALADRHPGE